MKLYCVRHAEAETAGQGPERALTENGKRDITKVAQYLGQYDLHIRHILHSDKLRAKQTAEILAKYMHIEEVSGTSNLLMPEADIEPIVDMVKTWSEDTMIVGHLPFMAKFISALTINNENFFPIVSYPPGCIVALDHYEHNRWIISWLIHPNIVPDHG